MKHCCLETRALEHSIQSVGELGALTSSLRSYTVAESRSSALYTESSSLRTYIVITGGKVRALNWGFLWQVLIFLQCMTCQYMGYDQTKLSGHNNSNNVGSELPQWHELTYLFCSGYEELSLEGHPLTRYHQHCPPPEHQTHPVTGQSL